MRRCVVLLLLIVLPLQWSWAAAASRCGHEQYGTSSHFGHHVYQHGDVRQATSHSPSGGDDAGTLVGEDPDCAVCHLGCGQAPASDQVEMLVVTLPVLVPTAVSAPENEFPSSIYRPNWP